MPACNSDEFIAFGTLGYPDAICVGPLFDFYFLSALYKKNGIWGDRRESDQESSRASLRVWIVSAADLDIEACKLLNLRLAR